MCRCVCVEGKVVSVCTGVSLYVNRCVSPCVHRCVCVGGEVVSVCRCVWGGFRRGGGADEGRGCWVAGGREGREAGGRLEAGGCQRSPILPWGSVAEPPAVVVVGSGAGI